MIDGKKLVEERAMRVYDRYAAYMSTEALMDVAADEFSFVAGLIEALQKIANDFDSSARAVRETASTALESLEKEGN